MTCKTDDRPWWKRVSGAFHLYRTAPGYTAVYHKACSPTDEPPIDIAGLDRIRLYLGLRCPGCDKTIRMPEST